LCSCPAPAWPLPIDMPENMSCMPPA
jgi:hypothetical protein